MAGRQLNASLTGVYSNASSAIDKTPENFAKQSAHANNTPSAFVREEMAPD